MSPVLAGVGVTDHRSVAVVDLCFFPRGAGDDHPGLDGGLLPHGRDEAPHARIARREAVVIDQVLPDGHGVAPAAERRDDQLAVGFAGARPRRSTRAVPRPGGLVTRARAGRGCRRWVGGHLRRNGRFCRTSGRPATAPHREAGGLQVVAGGSRRTPVAASIRRSDQPRRPSARTCCRFSSAKTLLMPGRNSQFPTRVNVSGRYRKWPVFNCPLMAGFGCPPRDNRLRNHEPRSAGRFTSVSLLDAGSGNRRLRATAVAGRTGTATHLHGSAGERVVRRPTAPDVRLAWT